jgi:hypothetical protein
MDQPLGRPLLVRAVRRGHVFVQRGEAAATRAASMAGHALAAMQQLHQRVGDARFEFQPHQRMRHAVAVEGFCRYKGFPVCQAKPEPR